jgi:hypothetical protein
MVQEMRRIVLNHEELKIALDSHRRMTADFLPEGLITSCNAVDGQNIKIAVQIPVGGSSRSVELTLVGDDLLEPLIRFCSENNIMLPRSGVKTVLIIKNQIVLSITINFDPEQPDAMVDAARS